MWRLILAVLATGIALVITTGAVTAIVVAWLDARTARQADKQFRDAVAAAKARQEFDEKIAASARSLDTMRARAIEKAAPRLRAR
jgi:hypothetical protein